MENELPVGWQCKRLDQIADFLDGQRKPIKEGDRQSIQGEYPYYGASGIIDYVNDYLFDDELILLGEDGANIVNRSSPLAFRVSGKCWVNNHAHVIKPRVGTEIDFLVEYLESLNYSGLNSGTAQPKLNLASCRLIPVLLPPIEEQKVIATVLSTWDRGIRQLSELIAAKVRFKQGLMQQLLTGKRRFSNPNNQTGTHHTSCGEVPIDWSMISLSEITSEIKRRNGEGECRVLTASGTRGLVDQRDYFNRKVAGESLEKNYLLKRGEFAYNRSLMKGYPYGATKRLDNYDSGVLSTLYLCFQLVSEKCNSDFLVLLFESGMLNSQLRGIARMGARAHGLLNVTADEFFEMSIPIPPLAEQKRIASFFTTIDSEIELLRQELEALKAQKKGLMQKLLTGKVRVPFQKENSADV